MDFAMESKSKVFLNLNLPGVGVKCPVEFGLVFIIKCDCGWLKWLIFDVALFIVVIESPAELCVCAKWWSRGGDTGSDFTLIGIGDVDGGGVLFDTANWLSALKIWSERNKAKILAKMSTKYLSRYWNSNGVHTLCAERYLYSDDSNWISPLHLMNSLKSLVARTNRDWDTQCSAFAMQRPEYLVLFVADAAGNMMKLDFLIVNISRMGSQLVDILRYKLSRRLSACLSSLVPV